MDRNRARQLSDQGVAAAMRGDNVTARDKWEAATNADSSWSVPFFNLAKSCIDAKEVELAARYLDKAEALAQKGVTSEDAQVLQQASLIRTRIMLQTELKQRPTTQAPEATGPVGNCAHCGSKITLPAPQLRKLQLEAFDRSSMGRACDHCKVVSCLECYGQNESKCRNCGSVITFWYGPRPSSYLFPG